MSNNTIKNISINLDDESNSEDLDLERIHYLANLPLDELSKAYKLSCIENDNRRYDLSEQYPSNNEESTERVASPNEIIIRSESPSSPLSSPMYSRNLRKRRAIQLQPFTMERKMYWNSLGRYVRDGSKPTGSKKLLTNITKSKENQQQHKESSFPDTQTSFIFDDYLNQGTSSDSSYNDINNTMDISDNDDIASMESDDGDDDDDDKKKKQKNKDKNDSNNNDDDDDDQDTDIEDILYGITKTVDTKQKLLIPARQNKNVSTHEKKKKEKTIPINLDDDDDTDIEDILNIREKSSSIDMNDSLENTTKSNTTNNSKSNITSALSNVNINESDNDDNDDDEGIVHISKRRRVIMESDSDDDNNDDDNHEYQDQKNQHVHKQNNYQDIFDFPEFEQPNNQLYIPNRRLQNKNLVTYKSSHNKKYSIRKEKIKDKLNKKNKRNDIFDFPSEYPMERDKVNDIFDYPSRDIMEIDDDNNDNNVNNDNSNSDYSNNNVNNHSNSNKSHAPKQALKQLTAVNPPVSFPFTSSSLSSTCPRQPHHLKDVDGFIVYEENEHAERRRNITLKELRQTKKTLKGILPLSFAKVYKHELDEEELNQNKKSITSHGHQSNSNIHSQKSKLPFHISHDDDDEDNGNSSGINRSDSNIQSSTINQVFDDFSDFYDDNDNSNKTNNNRNNNIIASNDNDGDNSTHVTNRFSFNHPTYVDAPSQTHTHKKKRLTTNKNKFIDTDDPISTLTDNKKKERLTSSNDYHVPILATGTIFADDLGYFNNNRYKMFEDDPSQFLSESEIIFEKSFTSNDYKVKSSLMIAFFYQAFQSFYITWTTNYGNENGNHHDLQKTKEINNLILFLRFVTKCLVGYDNNNNNNNNNNNEIDNQRKKMLSFICKEIDIFLSRLFIITLWDDNIKSNTYEKMAQKNQNQKQQYLLLVILFFRLEWTFQLNKLNTSIGFDDHHGYSTLSLRTATQGLLWHLFSVGTSASSIKPQSSSSSITHVTSPIVIEIWIHLLNVIKKEKLEKLLWSTLQVYAALAFPLKKVKNNASVQDMILLCEKSDLIWFWLLTILILIRLERNSNGIYVLKDFETNCKLQPWNLINPILNEYRLSRPNCIHLNQYQLLHVLKAIRNNFYQCHFLISQYNWPWDNKLIELLFTLIEWQSLQLYIGDDNSSTHTSFLSINTDTASGYFPSFLMNYNGHIPDDTIKVSDSCGIIFLKIISFGLSRQVSFIINHAASHSVNENEKALEQLKQNISRMSSSYSIVVAASNTSSSELLHQMFSNNRQRFLDPNYEDPFISFAFHYTINIIILHCICRLNIYDLIHSVTKRNITIQSKVHTETAWASDIKTVAISLYHKIKKYWKVYS